MLSLTMAFGLFSVVPVSAETTEIFENYKNITFVDESQEVSTGNASTFEKKKSYLTVYSNLSGTELELHGIDSDFLAEKYANQASKIQSITYTAFKGKTASLDTLNPITFSSSSNSTGFVAMTDLNITNDTTTAGTAWSSSGWWNGNNATIYEVYATKKSEDVLYSQARVDAGFYDADLTLDLGEKTKVESLYLFGHRSCKTSFMTYGIFLSDDPDTLYNDENQIVFYDRYPLLAAGGGTTQGFNDYVRSEGQVYDFKGETKAARYVGIRMYDISGTANHVSIYDLGVYGSTYIEATEYPVEDAFKIETASSSSLAASFCGEAPVDAVAVTDAAGGTPATLLGGGEYTFTATDSEDGKYIFAGWYSQEGTLLSADPSYTISAYNGELLTAKYTTDYILNVEASEDIAITQKWNSAKLDGATTVFPSLEGESGWVYDADEGAMKITNPRDEKVSGGAVFSKFTSDGTNIMTNTCFEPYTTYKYTVRAKVETAGSGVVSLSPNLAVTGLLLGAECEQTATSGEGYTDFTVYFNSGAANYSGSTARRTNCVSTNLFAFTIPANSSVYIESWKIEKVNDIKIVADNYVIVDGEGNRQVDFGKNAYYVAAATTTSVVNSDTTCYDGATTVADCTAWLADTLANEGLFGAVADNETISFTVNSISGDPITEVTVNGVVIAPVDGVYTANVGVGTPKASNEGYAKSDEIIINIKSEVHECVFNHKVMDEKNLVENTTDTYYKRCACGATDPEHTFKPITEYNGVDLTKTMYNQPVWNESIQYNDIIMPYIGVDEYQLLYPVDELIAARSYDMKTVYLEGEDFEVTADGKIKLTENTTIPIFYSDNFKNEKEDGSRDWEQVNAWVGYSHLYQVYFTYTHSKVWEGTTYNVAPEPELDKLTNFVEKMSKGEDTHLLFYGDSLTDGWNASGLDEDSWQYKDKDTPASELSEKHSVMYKDMGYASIPEWACESWPKQVYNYLKTSLNNENLKYLNTAIGSTASEWGSKPENMDFLIREQCEKAWGEGVYPDIVFMGYGGNESGNTAEVQNANMKKIIDYVRTLNPDCSIVIYSCMYLNIYNKNTGEIDNKNLLVQEQGYYDLIKDYENIVLVPIHSRFLSLVGGKNPIHYMSNGYNHPNDFGVRYLADVMNAVLTLPEHVCEFNRQVAEEKYLDTAATCTEAAKYYYSCECGEKGTETFSFGSVDPLAHDMQTNDDGTAKVCKNGCGKEIALYTVTFMGKGETPIYTAIVEETNPYLSTEDIAAATVAIPNIYGYEFAGWDKGVEEEIVSATTITATYKKVATAYTVTVKGINHTRVLTDLAFDTRLEIRDDNATQWLIGENVIAVGTEVVVYVAGDMEITASTAEVSSEPSVAIINDVSVANANDNTYVTFAHVNAAGKTIKEMGFIYVTGTTYAAVGDENLTIAGLTAASKKYNQAKMPRTGADFMATLEGITNAKEVKRVARAYVIFEGDETVYYSNVVSKIFN